MYDGFHSHDGLFFRRNEDGSVTITQRVIANDKSPIVFQQTVDAGTWCSAVCNVTPEGEMNNRWYQAMEFHGVKP